jgi:flagellar biogenesis protein FliO
MLQSIGSESAIKKANKTQCGLATSLLLWAQKAVTSGFGGLGRVRADKRMELIETLQLGGKRQLMLVKCDGMEYLVGAGGDSVHSIAEMSPQQVTSAIPRVIAEDRPQIHREIKPSAALFEGGWSQ